MTLLAVPVALAVGVVLGAMGGGGAVLAVPALVTLLDQTPQQATTSSLVVVGVTALVALVPHARRGHVRVGQGVTFGLVGIAGSVAGSAVAGRLPGTALMLAFAALLLIVAALMLRRALRPTPVGADEVPAGPMLTLRPLTCACPRVARLAVTATVVGLLTGLLGVGGGFVVVPALVLALALPMPVAVGTSLVVIALNCVTAFVSRIALWENDLDWQLIGTFTAVAVLGSLAGARLADRVPARALTAGFAALLLAVAVHTAGTNLA